MEAGVPVSEETIDEQMSTEEESEARQRYQLAKGILADLLELPLDERPEALDSACGDEVELHREVASLLAAAETETADGFLDGPLLHRAGDGVGVGSEVGAFTLEQELGEGGMGMVFRATRREGFEQQAAIKLIKPGMASREIVSRFEHERQILAGLDHPNIARLFDGGSCDDERPFFVMEYVEGEPIDAYCERHALSLGERLELFEKVCRAVRFAHRRSVLHRDLKPANILVSERGEPKLLDFGIAKLVGEEDSLAAKHDTAGTPLFASPEQLKGKPLTTASDVYSLGVLLYILLCGARHDEGLPTGAGPVRARALKGHPVAPPSTKTDDPARRRALGGDLDAIALEALRPEPDHRYPSVDELLADLERRRDGYPVLARRGNWSYRAQKMLRRHKGRFLGALAILILVAVSLVALVERRQRARDAALIEATNKFIYEVLQAGSPKEVGKVEPVLRDLLEKGVNRIDVDLGEYPEAGAGFLSALGRTYRHLGDYDRAEDLLRESLLRRRLMLPAVHDDIATSCNNLALVLREKGDYAEAEELLREALKIYIELEGSESENVAKAYGNLAGLRRAQGDRIQAVELFAHSLELRRPHLDPEHRSLAIATSNLAKATQELGDLERAASLYRRAVDMLSLLIDRAEEDGKDTEGLEASRATVLHNLGGLLRLEGDLPGAAWRLRESLENRRDSYSYLPHHRKIAEVERSLALLERDLGRLDEAQGLMDGALEKQIVGLGEDHPEVAYTLHEMAILERLRGDDEAARELAERALAIQRARLDPDHWRMEETRQLLRELDDQGSQRSTTGR